jgi:DNA processing protein
VSLELTQPAYVFALSRVEGLGPKSLLRVLKVFPGPDSLAEAPNEVIHDKLGEDLSRILFSRLLGHWEQAYSSAQEVISRHIEKKVVPVAITDSKYPPLLKLISDPPPILFVRGNLETLSMADALAVVGTRGATELGKEVAGRIAKYFAKRGYVIVSGLAKGIDTAAHKGAVEAEARTVAVLGTALDQIYPAENRELAERIANDSGALITELPLGRKSFRNAFVQRDRIQSGMSLAVIPVQTDVTGGTMHTVRFAEQHGRLLLCPKPLVSEQGLHQYAGISELIRTGRAREFQSDAYESLLNLFQDHKRKLLSGEVVMAKPQVAAEKPEPQVEAPPKENKEIPSKRQSALGFAEDVEETVKDALPLPTDEEIKKLIDAIRELGLHENAKGFKYERGCLGGNEPRPNQRNSLNRKLPRLLNGLL